MWSVMCAQFYILYWWSLDILIEISMQGKQKNKMKQHKKHIFIDWTNKYLIIDIGAFFWLYCKIFQKINFVWCFVRFQLRLSLSNIIEEKNKDDGSDNLFKYKIGLQKWIFHQIRLTYKEPRMLQFQ